MFRKLFPARFQSFIRFAKSSNEPDAPSLEQQRKTWQKANPKCRVLDAEYMTVKFDDETIDELTIVYSVPVERARQHRRPSLP